jgi:hypothetical protein
MLDEAGSQNFFNHTHDLFIRPELDTRKLENRLTDDFRIRECLIRLPQNKPPIVEFNNEFGWDLENPELAPGITLEPGKPFYLHELVSVGKVLPSVVDDKRVAFVYIFWTGFGFSIVFDYQPTSPDFDPEKDDFGLGEAIALHLRLNVIEMAVKGAKAVQPQLRQIGLWPVTALLPYPISKIVERVGTGNLEDARALLVEYCTPDFIEQKLVGTWHPIGVFQERMQVFHEALFNHRNKKFHSAIYTLVPQVEGVITDWLYQTMNPDEVHWKPESKIKQFWAEMDTVPQLEYMWREVLESVSEFLLDGPPLKIFRKWLDAIDVSFPGRHPVAHGRYADDIFIEEMP